MNRSDQADKPSLSRRQVFAAGGTVGALAAAAAALPLVQQSAPVAEAAKAVPEAGGGYQLTQHVMRYYQTARV